MMRKNSNIVVHVLDYEEVKIAAYEQLSSILIDDNMVLGLLDNGPYGYIETNVGVFVINHTGIGPIIPVTNNGPVLEFYTAFKDGSFISTPSVSIPITLEFIKNVPVKESVPLDEFILKYSTHQENSFNFWDDYINRLGAKNTHNLVDNEQEYEVNEEYETTCPLIRCKDDLKKYSTFLVPEQCTCKTSEPLIEVTENICCIKSSHVHCKLCGGVI